MTTKPKIFCIGLNKTGTISLHHALELLGFRSLHWGGPETGRIIQATAAAGRPLVADLDEYDAFSDLAILSKQFRLLDSQYPGSKFILSTRPIDGWLQSREAHVLRNQERARTGEYTGNFLEVDVDAWRTEFVDHHRKVEEYFAGREQDLLVFRITEGDGWEKLCPFLGVEIPNEPFPWHHRLASARPAGGSRARSRNTDSSDS